MKAKLELKRGRRGLDGEPLAATELTLTSPALWGEVADSLTVSEVEAPPGHQRRWEDAMEQAASEQADRALRQYVNGGRTLADIGVEFAYLRQERGLSQHTLAQRVTLPLETVQAVESGVRATTVRRPG